MKSVKLDSNRIVLRGDRLMFALVIKLLLMIGVSETRAVAVAQSRLPGYIAVGLLTLFGAWYLTHIGGNWREASIREKWAARFAAIEKTNAALVKERDDIAASVSEQVRNAIDALPKQVKCELPADAAKRLNKIRR